MTKRMEKINTGNDQVGGFDGLPFEKEGAVLRVGGRNYVTIGYLVRTSGLFDATIKDGILAAAVPRYRYGQRFYYDLEKANECLKKYNLPRVNKETGLYVAEDGRKFASATQIKRQYGWSVIFMSKAGSVESRQGRDSLGHIVVLYSIDDLKNVNEVLKSGLFYDEGTKEVTIDGVKWITVNNRIIKKLLNRGAEKILEKDGFQKLWLKTKHGNTILAYRYDQVVKVGGVIVDQERGIYTDENGKQFAGINWFVNEYGVSHTTISTRIHEAGLKGVFGSYKKGRKTFLFRLDEVKPLLEKYQVPKAHHELQLYVDLDGEAWMTSNAILDKFEINILRVRQKVIRTISGKDSGGHRTIFYNVSDALRSYGQYDRYQAILSGMLAEYRIAREEQSRDKRTSVSAVEELISVPDGWFTEDDFLDHVSDDLKGEVPRNALKIILSRKEKTGDQLHKKIRGKLETKSREYFHRDLLPLVINHARSLIGFDFPPNDWRNAAQIAGSGGYDYRSILRIAERHRDNVHYRKCISETAKLLEYYHPVIIGKIMTALDGARDRREKIGSAGGEWKTVNEVAKILGVSNLTIVKRVLRYRDTNPEWFAELKTNRGFPTEHLHADMIVVIKKEIEAEEKDEPHADIFSELKIFSQDIINATTVEAKLFRSFMSVFGSSRAIDLLFKFRPGFKGLPVERVRSHLANFLGDFLAAKHEFSPKNFDAQAAEMLSDPTLQEGFYETMKDHCLQHYFEQRRTGVRGDAYQIIFDYMFHIVDELESVSNKDLENVIERVGLYFASAIREFHKPKKFIDHITEGREFPDLNQKINMKELADKKRMLIADEMGLGKSASVIMAKEHMQVGCALVIVPSNVTATWQGYLCDDPRRSGYFKPGQAPRVLTIETPTDLDGVTKDQYDYILISHEKLNGRYAPLLEQLDPDMLIVDEVHKLKKLGGAHARSLMPIARKLEDGENRYVALLSGTPVPNKVRDIALVLKLLYPERFAKMSHSDLIRNIVHGDIIDLRSLLVPRMQMKELEDVVEMPAREQKLTSITMSSAEADVYEALLEEDELTAQEKMQILRQFLLNPAMLDSTPNIAGSKIEMLCGRLHEAFAIDTKVVLLVNNYITDVIRGNKNIIPQLGLPSDVEVAYIYGGDENKRDRAAVQERFNTAPEKMLLVVSGGTADVGISLVGAQRTIVYNEPWTESDLRQQKARVFRPGLTHDIREETLVVAGTIEEGIHEYIGRKHHAIEKILKGIPLSELEQRMLVQREDKHEGEDVNFEVNPELARTYFSWKQRLTQMFGHTKQLGEAAIAKFLETWGPDYARGYREVGSRSYQSNVNRVAGTLIGEMLQSRVQHDPPRILDVASGPEMLRRHMSALYQQHVQSLDLNPHHFADSTSGATHVGSWTKMPFESGAFDVVNCAMAFHDSSFAPSRGMYERLDVLREMNRVLHRGGRAVISMIYSMALPDMEKFTACAATVGFRVVPEYTGHAEFDTRFYSHVITLEKIGDVQKSASEIVAEIGADAADGLKMKKTKRTIRNDREILTGFLFDGKAKIIKLNDADQVILQEEKKLADEAAQLKRTYRTIKDIPPDEVVKHQFVRIRIGKQYVLFKRLTTAPGVIILH